MSEMISISTDDFRSPFFFLATSAGLFRYLTTVAAHKSLFILRHYFLFLLWDLAHLGWSKNCRLDHCSGLSTPLLKEGSRVSLV